MELIDGLLVEKDVKSPQAALAIEVSWSTLRRDRGRQASLYAVAGVEQYWAYDVKGRHVVVHRGPSADGYAEILEVGPGGTLEAASCGVGPLGFDDLLHATGRVSRRPSPAG